MSVSTSALRMREMHWLLVMGTRKQAMMMMMMITTRLA